jgi:hypothetical protein
MFTGHGHLGRRRASRIGQRKKLNCDAGLTRLGQTSRECWSKYCPAVFCTGLNNRVFIILLCLALMKATL